MPVLGISFEVSVAHQLVIFEHSYPRVFVLFLVNAALELFDCHRVSVKVLQHYVVEEGYLDLLVELDLDESLARLLLLHHRLRG